MTLTFLTLPISTNQLYRVFQNRSILSARGRSNKDAIAWEARAQHRGKPLAGPLAVEISLFWPDRRKHDIDNLKALLDACTGILWDDDGQIADLHTMKEYDKANPRVEMRVWELS
ncbi:Holliday junction endonuclease RusA [Sphingomonas changbaiensis NBRC 104936]|uniref:Crossover junction endodeoxyribonuclease RusA n=1 Tax=Sphingomonas changbaiensis NBRC 104936 TaxID=1219043 RepID=A0A0E9MLP8_9SPHN|nr:RusA family crossover junction endodeoxyribonuclease [Sphingomonas changbaiensis]GAO38351.1 Holliday junction endonuclease RusA [Sphingomonas changbaiensis NBRC 104936]